uniref:Uncharacterized protein n=1 Tax=Guillardia theta TaxID=55529 RepID=A0A7S4N9N4_GUITH|mmetsp:Transcript_18543/g.60872  ORF Transcript_18543/g.60872 Transcript_18543/m.60872 type:complete len:106 (+) Transcript_18543:386-703(+)
MCSRNMLEQQQKKDTRTPHLGLLAQEEMYEIRQTGGGKHGELTSVQEHEYTRLQDVMSRFKVIYNEESSRLKDALRRFLESNSTLEKALKECVECEEALLASESL